MSKTPIAHTIDGEPLFEEQPPKTFRFPEPRPGKRWVYVGKGPKNEGRFKGRFAVCDKWDGRHPHYWFVLHGNSMIQWRPRARFIIEVDGGAP